MTVTNANVFDPFAFLQERNDLMESPTVTKTTFSKAAIIRLAIANGCESTKEIVAYGKENHNREIKPSDVANFRSAQKKSQESKTAAPPAKDTAPATNGNGNPLDSAVVDLCLRYGPYQVKDATERLINVLKHG